MINVPGKQAIKMGAPKVTILLLAWREGGRRLPGHRP